MPIIVTASAQLPHTIQLWHPWLHLLHLAHSTQLTRVLCMHSILPHMLVVVQDLHLPTHSTLHFLHSEFIPRPSADKPHFVFMADPFQFMLSSDPFSRLLFKFFGRFFISICLFFFACMPLNNVATMYKNQPVSLENIIQFCSFPLCALSTPSRTLALLLSFTCVLSPFRF